MWAKVATLVSYAEASLSVAIESTTFDLMYMHVLAGWFRRSFVYRRPNLALEMIHKAEDLQKRLEGFDSDRDIT